MVNLLMLKQLNHQVKAMDGILGNECRQLMQDFFSWRRKTDRKYGETAESG